MLLEKWHWLTCSTQGCYRPAIYKMHDIWRLSKVKCSKMRYAYKIFFFFCFFRSPWREYLINVILKIFRCYYITNHSIIAYAYQVYFSARALSYIFRTTRFCSVYFWCSYLMQLFKAYKKYLLVLRIEF